MNIEQAQALEMKGLEALDNLKLDNYSFIENAKNRIIIKKELKRLEELEKAFDSLVKENETLGKMLSKEIEKNRALEIIKNKGVFVHLLQQSKNVEEYNSLMLVAFKKMAERDYKGAVEKFCLTQEEYDLLKEVML